MYPPPSPQLATAGVQPCGSWLSRYYAAVERQLEEGAWGGGDLANLLWGLAKFDLMPEVREGEGGRGGRQGGRQREGRGEGGISGCGARRPGGRGGRRQEGDAGVAGGRAWLSLTPTPH